MGLFDGGAMDTIRCDETDFLIWKWCPKGTTAKSSKRTNAIRWGSSLRVKTGQAAVFVYQTENGFSDYIEGPFDEIIKTENFPVLASLIGKLYNGDSPFQAEVYFINLANIIQIKFGVPYFDVFDPRFLDFGVPTAVRGSINFKITDYKEFVRLHSLNSFDVTQFQAQVKDSIIRYVKDTVTNAPIKNGIPVVQMERQLSQINSLVEDDISEALHRDFGVTVTRVDISSIDIDKTSREYKKLQSLTQNKAVVFAQATQNVVDTMGTHRIGAKKILKSAKKDDSPVENTISTVGKKVSDAFSSFGSHKKQKGAPPPLPILHFYVAIDGKQAGPFDMETISQKIKDGIITKTNLVWKEGMKNWEKAGTVEEFSELFEQ